MQKYRGIFFAMLQTTSYNFHSIVNNSCTQ